jgi:hypothetical protein
VPTGFESALSPAGTLLNLAQFKPIPGEGKPSEVFASGVKPVKISLLDRRRGSALAKDLNQHKGNLAGCALAD